MIGIGDKEPEGVEIIWIERAVASHLFEQGFNEPDPVLGVLLVGDVAKVQWFSHSLGENRIDEFSLIKVSGNWRVLPSQPH